MSSARYTLHAAADVAIAAVAGILAVAVFFPLTVAAGAVKRVIHLGRRRDAVTERGGRGPGILARR